MARADFRFTDERNNIYWHRSRMRIVITLIACLLGFSYSVIFHVGWSVIAVFAVVANVVYFLIGFYKKETVPQLLISERQAQKARKSQNMEDLTSYADTLAGKKSG